MVAASGRIESPFDRQYRERRCHDDCNPDPLAHRATVTRLAYPAVGAMSVSLRLFLAFVSASSASSRSLLVEFGVTERMAALVEEFI
jgi:hypothetical protein